jgi:ABC-2 type transport system ATP-binding protein
MISIRQLTVSYGDVCALSGLSLEIPGSGIFGLLGRNGAGKTTTIRAILGLVRRDSGEVLVSGEDPYGNHSARRRMSVLFSEDGLIQALKVRDNLEIWARLFGYDGMASGELADSVLEKLGIGDLALQNVRNLSTGNRRIVALARTFMLDSDLYILDEPTASLDPVRAGEIRSMLSMLAGSRPVILSTHNLHEAEELCSEIAVIDRGSLVLTGKPGEMGGEGKRYLIRSGNYPLTFRGRKLDPREDGFVILETEEPPQDVLSELIESGNAITEFRPARSTLSDVFMKLVAGGD